MLLGETRSSITSLWMDLEKVDFLEGIYSLQQLKHKRRNHGSSYTYYYQSDSVAMQP